MAENSSKRDERPTMDDVRDVPHVLYVGAERRGPVLGPDRIRTFVNNLRFQRMQFHQDAEGAIWVENRRYVPMRDGGE